MRIVPRLLLVALSALGLAAPSAAQELDNGTVGSAVAGFTMREVGPAVAGGRIADIAVHPTQPATWYLAVGSGGVWKTTNAGTTWKPIFDDQPSYSIGTVALDPTNPEVVWVGTGENVSGRHVGWGSGLYRSRDGGRTWENVGLETSEHIGKILIDPKNGDHVLVASEGPLWSTGGERGVFRSTDGGESWNRVLHVNDDTGITDLEFEPGNPSTVYAAAYQRRRHIWGLMAGGESSGIYKSTDSGETWREVTVGLPNGPMGKIGLAVTKADPSIVYATIEASDGEQGFYRSLDRGESWERRNGYTSGGTGPHYYQEIEASPADPDEVIQMDVFFQITRDGGASFQNLGTGREKHSDNHALWIDPKNTDHMLAGSDAGLYETFDQGATWRHFPNLPISQFYKVAVSYNEPFYELLGGAQDLGTLWGPARTANVEGVRNSDWYFPMGADGYGVEIDPRDPDILYLMTQQGNLYRTDRASEESLQIQPQPAPGDPPERWNWDSPLLLSPHDPSTVYFGSQRLWRSNDRGNSWSAISDDLTTNTNRYELPYMGRVWSVDAMHDNGAMSKYATLTTISESPVEQGLLYTGSDDGLIHVSDDGGDSWTRAADLPGVPERSFINKVVASQHSAGSLFALADAHKTGDYTPYLFESTDNGQSWSSIRGDLPDGTIPWALQQDHVEPNLLFLAGEFGLYVSVNRGQNWHRFETGAPTIAFRDVQLQRRDNDIVGATFGRGFYIVDDYAPLRELANQSLSTDAVATILPTRDAWWYVPSVPNQAAGRPTLGSTAYAAPNPDFGATLSVWVSEGPESARSERESREDDIADAGGNVPFPGYDVLTAEQSEGDERLLIQISDSRGEAVRWLAAPFRQGLHRMAWDLRYPAPEPIDLSVPDFVPPWASDPVGPMVAPGRYTAELFHVAGNETTSLGSSDFEVKAVPTLAEGTNPAAVVAFQLETSELRRQIAAAGSDLSATRNRLRYMRAALAETPSAPRSLYGDIDDLEAILTGLSTRLFGDRVRGSLNESTSPSISGRVGNVMYGHWSTRQAPTETQRENIRIAEADFATFAGDLEAALQTERRIEQALIDAGAPWTPRAGR